MILRSQAGVEVLDPGPDLLSSASSGPFPLSRAFDVPSYFEDNLLALRHWRPPGE